jgi:single-stranded-DNA-specific exonuclease
MAPLVDENRRIVRAGLPALAATRRPGLRALMEISRVHAPGVGTEDIGYKLGPRLNAAGRIAHAGFALELLSTDDEDKGAELAFRMDALNRERQLRTQQAVDLATELMGDDEPPPLIMLGHAEFSSGIVGLIAAKLVSLYGRPSVVYELGQETSRASCRSIDEFHITDALRENAEMFVRFGGHRAAAGFTAENGRIDEIRERLIAAASRELAGRELAPVLEIDCNLPLRQLRGEEVRWISRLGPFGIGNPEPTFLARGVMVTEQKWIGDGERHRRLKLRDGNVTWGAVAFDQGDTGISEGDRIDAVYTVESTSSRLDGTLEIRVEDMRPARDSTETV